MDLLGTRYQEVMREHADAIEAIPRDLGLLNRMIADNRYATVRVALIQDIVATLEDWESVIGAHRNNLVEILNDFTPHIDLPGGDDRGITVAEGTGMQAGNFIVFDGTLCVKIEKDRRLAEEYAQAMRNARTNGWIGDQSDVNTLLNTGQDPVTAATERQIAVETPEVVLREDAERRNRD